jgi:hypothetical protein
VVEDEHEAEDLVEFEGAVGILVTFEERNEDVVLPVVIKAVLFLVYLVDLDDG